MPRTRDSASGEPDTVRPRAAGKSLSSDEPAAGVTRWPDGLDADAATTLGTAAEIKAEVARLRRAYDMFLSEETLSPAPIRDAQALRDWQVRDAEDDIDDPEMVDDADFAAVTLPDYRPAGQIHYRHYIEAPTSGRGVTHLCFGSVDYEAAVYWNGQLVGGHKGYFAKFSIDISHLLGEQVRVHQLDVVVRRADDRVEWDGALAALNHGDAHGKGLGSVVGDRVTAGAGLLGEVTVEYRPEIWIDDLWATGDPDGQTASVTVTLMNTAEVLVSATLECRIRPRNAAGPKVTSSLSVDLTAKGTSEHRLVVPVADARIWRPTSPWLYWVDINIRVDEQVVDGKRTRLAFRTFERSGDGTLLLNGDPYFLRGTTTIGCLWEAAWRGDEEAVTAQLLLVRALFANTLRVHVHVLPEIVYDCADRLGILIYQDAPWQWPCFEPVSHALDEEIGQIAELARHVRGHPSVVVLSLSNEMHMAEPLHQSDLEYLQRAQQIATDLAGGLVLVQDHTGPDRPRDLVCSVHEYPGYFVGTARSEVDVLSEVQGDHRVVVSEYGAGAIESWAALAQLVKASEPGDGESQGWPVTPEDPWTVEGLGDHVLAETLSHTQRVIGRRLSWRDYHDASNEHQARVLLYQTGALRRDRDRVSGAIQHFLRYPAILPYNPWCDLAIVDAAGVPTAGFGALREAFRPVALDIVAGGSRAYAGAEVGFVPWIYNDLPESMACRVQWKWGSFEAGTVLAEGELEANIPPTSSVRLDTIDVSVPGATRAPEGVRLVATLLVNDQRWCSRTSKLEVIEWPQPLEQQVEVIGDRSDAKSRLGSFGVTVCKFGNPEPAQRTILVSPGTALADDETKQLHQAAAEGARVVLLERPPGEVLRWLDPLRPPLVIDGGPCEIVQPEYSLRTSGLSLSDLTNWATFDGRVVDHPLLGVDTRTTPRWASCGDHLSLSAVHEYVIGLGSVVICQALIWHSLANEPSAWRLLCHLLNKPTRRI